MFFREVAQIFGESEKMVEIFLTAAYVETPSLRKWA